MDRLLLCAAYGLFLALASALCEAEPYIPGDDNIVVEHLRDKRTEGNARELAAIRAELAVNPNDIGFATKAAWRYIEQSRASSDPRYLGYAQAALKPWWDLDSPPVPVLVLRATLKQSVHDFEGALKDLELALKRDPLNAQAWLTRATVLQVQGKYEKAFSSCGELRRIAPDWIYAVCSANVASLNGRARQSYDALASLPAVPESQQAWVQSSLAEIAHRRGEFEKAEAHYKRAIAAGDSYAKGAYADFLLDRGRYREVLELLQEGTRADALLLRLALAQHALNDAGTKQHVDALSARFAASRMRGDKVHLREEARFTLHLLQKPREALELAQENWKTQREPADARILLEAALAARDPRAAQPAVEFLRESNLEDRSLQRLVAQVIGGERSE